MDRVEREIARAKKLQRELTQLNESWAARPQLPTPTPPPTARIERGAIRG